MSEPLWSDERIIAEVDDALWEADSESRERARRLLRKMRDELIAEADDVMAGQIRQVSEQYKERITKLEAEKREAIVMLNHLGMPIEDIEVETIKRTKA